MTVICAWCQKHIGEKEPIEIQTETHGICQGCFTEMVERVQHDETPHVEEEAFGGAETWLGRLQTQETAAYCGGTASKT